MTSSSPARLGVSMALMSMLCVQLGLAAAVALMHQVGPAGAAWLRLFWAGLLLLAVARPKRSALTREALLVGSGLGVVTAGVTLLFMAALSRLPLGTASAIEFLGPLGVAVARSRGLARGWALVALGGVLCLTQPWTGRVDAVGVGFALGAAACWAAYILLTQRIGDVVSGLGGLAISMPVAAVVASVVVGPSVVTHLTWELLAYGLGLAILLPVVPFALELLALRRLTTAAFGTLMALEPAFALGVGIVFLGQVPHPLAGLGIALVVVAGVGAERSGSRSPTTTPATTATATATTAPATTATATTTPATTATATTQAGGIATQAAGIAAHTSGDTCAVRLTTFWSRMEELLGPTQADTFARYRVLSELGNRTVHEALESGEPAKEVWRVVCQVTDAPSHLR